MEAGARSKWLLAFVVGCVLIALLPRTAGDLEPVLKQCCDLGFSWAYNHTTCSGPSLLPGISSEQKTTCLTALYICCIRTHRTTNCERGKQAARFGHDCAVLHTPGGEIHKDCCDGCSLGLKAGSMRMPCSFSNFAFGTPWDEAYIECCSKASTSNQGTSSQSGRRNNRCETEHTCSQKCEDTGVKIQCSCYPGYRLSSDQHSCEDVNECELGTDSCNSVSETCLNSIGGFQCIEKDDSSKPVRPGQCPAGYFKNPETLTCDDIDECSDGSGTCKETELCTNTIGAFTCTPRTTTQCPPGFKLHEGTSRCIDVDECAEGIHGCDRDKELCLNSYGGYQCQLKTLKGKDCLAGFKWNNNAATCEDIDECTENIHNCNAETQICVNAVGSFRCILKVTECPHGYRRNVLVNRCEDINECIENSHDCDRNRQYCVNTHGSYQCHTRASVPAQKCGTGLAFDIGTGTCKDVNECEESRPCMLDQTCENILGSYRCICQQGYTMDPVSKNCRDVNECQLGLHSCAQSQRCDNTIGSFTCVRMTSCGTGYTLNAGIGECEDDDECQLGTHNCGPGFVCRNTVGSFRCDRVRCPTGQRLLSDGSCQVITCSKGMEPDDSGNCIDINECSGQNVCRSNQRCINTVGSYRCQNLLSCGSGFELNEYGNQCVDIDECVRRIHECGAQQICRNRQGSYSCECPAGYTLNIARECEDIDECTRFQGQICSINSECQNTQGSYICNCKAGFRKADDGRNCVDVDECADSPNICQQNCINVWGSYQCSCRPGYTLAADGRSCQDVDECALWEGRGSLCIGFCVNEPGSYSCSCPEGYRLLPDKRTCQDIDECQEQNVCKGENEVCLNTRGSFKCNIITCPSNYVRDRDHRNRCKSATLECRRGEAECLKKPLSFSYNYITFVSNMRIPPTGQLDLFTMRGPGLPSTTVQFTLELKDARAPDDITTVTRNYFHLRRTAFNEAMVSLVKSIPGPQEIELELVMKMYHNGLFGGSAVAKIFIFVTPHEF